MKNQYVTLSDGLIADLKSDDEIVVNKSKMKIVDELGTVKIGTQDSRPKTEETAQYSIELMMQHKVFRVFDSDLEP